MDELGNGDKNRKMITSRGKWLSVWCHQVVIAKHQYMGMTWGTVHALRCSIYRMQLRPATSAEHSQMRLPSPTVHNVSLLNQMSASHEEKKLGKLWVL
jgi:hypothetical protein